MSDDTHPLGAAPAPTPEQLEYGRRRDELADQIEWSRTRWHEARTAVDLAMFELRLAMRREAEAQVDYRAAVAAHEAHK